jgi:Fe2+ transport system protein FeoA
VTTSVRGGIVVVSNKFLRLGIRVGASISVVMSAILATAVSAGAATTFSDLDSLIHALL